MSRQSLDRLNRVLDRLERRAQRPARRFSGAPVALGLGLALGYVLLVQLVPRVWPSVMTEAFNLHWGGWPAWIWRLSMWCQTHPRQALGGIAGLSALLFGLGYYRRSVRLASWLAALAVVAADAAVVALTLFASWNAAGAPL